MNEEIQKLVEGLIACDHSPFTEEDSEQLAGFSEEKLSAMAASFAEIVTPEPDPEPQPEPVIEEEPIEDDEPKKKTDEEWLAEAPESLRKLVERSQGEEEDRRSHLVGAIAKATDAYGEDALTEKTTEDLEALARALRLDQPIPDFSAKVSETPRAAESNPAPQPYTEGLKARQNAN